MQEIQHAKKTLSIRLLSDDVKKTFNQPIQNLTKPRESGVFFCPKFLGSKEPVSIQQAGLRAKQCLFVEASGNDC